MNGSDSMAENPIALVTGAAQGIGYACAEAIADVADGLGLSPTIAYVSGDDLLPRLDELAAAGIDLIDFDTGAVIRGESTPDDLAEEMLEMLIEVASGRKQTKAQLLGQDDFQPWKRGVSL